MRALLPPAAAHRLVLASRSPRRHEILSRLGFEFEVDPAGHGVEDGVGVVEVLALPEELARRKCAQVAQRRPDDLVIGADTVVILGGEILEKPRDDDQAAAFLRRLSGTTHTVVSGVALMRVRDGVDVSGSERTRVTFRELSDEEIAAYVVTGEGRDKAGSYAAQGLGALLIRSFDGCFYNVVGLPVALLLELLKKV